MAQQLYLNLSDDLTPEERAVWNVLRYRKGEANAIKKTHLADAVGLHERQAREAIKTLIEVRHKPIGSTPGFPPGYFVIESIDEAVRVGNRYRSQALSLLRREAAVRRVSLNELLGQLTLELRRGV